MYGCQPHYVVTKEVEIPSVATTSRTTVWVKDIVDAHGNFISGIYLTEPETKIVLPASR